MAHAEYHAISSARKWGGIPDDYLPIHRWFDATAYHLGGDNRHRAIRHHSLGVQWAEEVFGSTIVNSEGHRVMVRYIGEQHCIEDLGRVPTMADWLREMTLKPWMEQRARRLSREIDL